MYNDHPLLGFGYQAFWYTQPGEELRTLYHYYFGYFSPGTAHNGYLDLWLELGFVGVTAFLLTVYVCLYRIVSWLAYRPAAALKR